MYGTAKEAYTAFIDAVELRIMKITRKKRLSLKFPRNVTGSELKKSLERMAAAGYYRRIQAVASTLVAPQMQLLRNIASVIRVNGAGGYVAESDLLVLYAVYVELFDSLGVVGFDIITESVGKRTELWDKFFIAYNTSTVIYYCKYARIEEYCVNIL